MTIHHEPYGIDDPYKRSATERFPRDPQAGQPVQIRFRIEGEADRAWVESTNAGRTMRQAAQPLGGGIWTADLGSFEGGRVEYVLRAEDGDASRSGGEVRSYASSLYRFDVGEWVRVSSVLSVERRPDGVRLSLGAVPSEPNDGTADGAAGTWLDISSPTSGSLRLDLGRGGTPGPSGQERAPLEVSQVGNTVSLRAQGIIAELDLETLALTARDRPEGGAKFVGSLGFEWLQLADGQVRSVRARFNTDTDEWLYGLGERFTAADRNGEAWDVRVYEEYKEQGKRTYLPVPFIVSERGYGVWLDADEPSYFDLREREAVVEVDRFVDPERGSEDGAAAVDASRLLSLVVLTGREPYEVTAAFTRLTGAIAVPPKWAFAPWMSSNSWNSQASAEAAIRRSVAEDVPAGVIVIEAWSDESTFYIFNDAKYEPKRGAERFTLTDFTFAGRWPDPKGFIDYCHQVGTRVVLWQIPVMKHLTESHVQHDNDERHMIEQGFAIANADGSPYRNKGWWFTDGLVVDFTNPEARDWWFAKRRYLFDELGIDGMKTDGGEHLWGRDLRAHDGRRGIQLFNAYPNLYVGAYHDFVQEMRQGDGVTFSRAGFTGAQRFPGHWAGDEDSSWDAYRASIRAGLSAGVCGVSMWSWDLGGFSGEIPPVELYLRSTAMAVFSPLMQYHSEGHGASEVRDRTPWNIAERHADPSALSVYKRFTHLRMRLLDLIHEDAVSLSARGQPLMRYPALVHPEEHDFLAEDPYAYLFGEDLFVAPVVDKGAFAREIRLPPGRWVDAWSASEFGGPRLLQVNADITTIPVFVRADSQRKQHWLAAFDATDGAG